MWIMLPVRLFRPFPCSCLSPPRRAQKLARVQHTSLSSRFAFAALCLALLAATFHLGKLVSSLFQLEQSCSGPAAVPKYIIHHLRWVLAGPLDAGMRATAVVSTLTHRESVHCFAPFFSRSGQRSYRVPNAQTKTSLTSWPTRIGVRAILVHVGPHECMNQLATCL